MLMHSLLRARSESAGPACFFSLASAKTRDGLDAALLRYKSNSVARPPRPTSSARAAVSSSDSLRAALAHLPPAKRTKLARTDEQDDPPLVWPRLRSYLRSGLQPAAVIMCRSGLQPAAVGNRPPDHTGGRSIAGNPLLIYWFWVFL